MKVRLENICALILCVFSTGLAPGQTTCPASGSYEWGGDRLGKLRDSPTIKGSIVSHLHKGEAYWVLGCRKIDDLYWLQLDVPGSNRPWTGFVKDPPQTKIGLPEIGPHFEISLADQNTIKVVGKDHLASTPHVELAILTDGPDGKDDQLESLGLLEDQEKSFDLPINTPKKFKVLLTSSGTISSRAVITREAPAVTVEAGSTLKVVSQGTNGEGRATLVVSCSSPVTLTRLVLPGLSVTLLSKNCDNQTSLDVPVKLSSQEHVRDGEKLEGQIYYRDSGGDVEAPKFPIQASVTPVLGAQWPLIASIGLAVVAFAALVFVFRHKLLGWISRQRRQPDSAPISDTLPPKDVQIPAGRLAKEDMEKVTRTIRDVVSEGVRAIRETFEAANRQRSEDEQSEIQQLMLERGKLQGALDTAAANQAALSEQVRELENRLAESDSLKPSEGRARQELQDEIANLKLSFVFVDPEAADILHATSRAFSDFIASCTALQGALLSIQFQASNANSALKNLWETCFSGFSIARLQSYITYTKELASSGRSVFPDLVGLAGRGATISAKQFREYAETLFFTNCLKGRWDRVLRGLERLRLLNLVVALGSEDTNRHQIALRDVQAQLTTVETAMEALGVSALHIPFGEQISLDAKQFVEIERSLPAGPFFAEGVTFPPQSVVDVTRWGYYKRNKRLWDDSSARIIVAAEDRQPSAHSAYGS